MPLLASSTYKAPWLLRNGHLMSIWAPLFRSVKDVTYEREELELQDGDFLLLDWCRTQSRRLVIVSHGLEGHSRRPYVLGMARTFSQVGWDVLAWNFRGCGGQVNRLPRFTTNASIGDLEAVVAHALKTGGYETIFLVGFSMGGNLTLMYLGSGKRDLPDALSGAAVFSVPTDLASAAEQLARPANRIYMRRFLRLMKEKLARLQGQHPELISLDGYEQIRDFRGFDDRYTAPLHGFRDARHYWEQGSSRSRLRHITVPTLCVNAADDPFLPKPCYPEAEASASAEFHLEIPRHGGHCGFVTLGCGAYWSERRALVFAQEMTSCAPGAR